MGPGGHQQALLQVDALSPENLSNLDSDSKVHTRPTGSLDCLSMKKYMYTRPTSLYLRSYENVLSN